MCDTAPASPSNNIAPHRGFNAKAREVLIGNDDMHLNGNRFSTHYPIAHERLLETK